MDALRWKRPLWLIIPILLIVAIVGGALLLRGNGLLLRNPPVGGPGGTVAGVLPGDFEVSTNGDATYSIPIEVPPGINQIEPDLSLIYSSHGGSGRLGVDQFGRLVAEQGPLPVSANVMPDQNCVGSNVTGPASQFSVARVVTLQSYQRIDDGHGTLYIQVNSLQSWTDGMTRDVRWQREYIDGRERSYMNVLQGTTPASPIYTCTVFDSEDRDIQNSIPQYATSSNPVCSPSSPPAAGTPAPSAGWLRAGAISGCAGNSSRDANASA